VRAEAPTQALLSLAEHAFAQGKAPTATTTGRNDASGATVCHGPQRRSDTPLTSPVPCHAASMTTPIREIFFSGAPAHIYV
jgi:hypothetical protein